MNMKQKIYKYEAIRSFMIAEMWKSTLRNTYTQNGKIKTNQQLVKRRNLFYFENVLFIRVGWKIRFLGGCMKNQYIGGEMPKMGDLDSLQT